MLSGISGEETYGVRNPSCIIDIVSAVSKSIGIILPVSVRIILREGLNHRLKLIHVGGSLKPQCVQPVLTHDHDLALREAGSAGNPIDLSILGQRIIGLRKLLINLLHPLRHILLNILRNILHASGFNHIRNHLRSIDREHIRQLLRACKRKPQLGIIVGRISAKERGFHLDSQLLHRKIRHGIFIDIFSVSIPSRILVQLFCHLDCEHRIVFSVCILGSRHGLVSLSRISASGDQHDRCQSQ